MKYKTKTEGEVFTKTDRRTQKRAKRNSVGSDNRRSVSIIAKESIKKK